MVVPVPALLELRAGRRSRLRPLAHAFWLVVIACGSSAPTSGAADGGGTDDAGASQGSVTVAKACGDYYDDVFGTGCNGPLLPAVESARQRGRFVSLCGALLGLPNTGYSAAAFDSCAAQVKAADACRFGDNATAGCPSMYETGGLQPGSSCIDGKQCLSGTCEYKSVAADGGLATAACGACAPFVAVGQACSPTANDQCAQAAACVGTPSVCAAITFGAAAGQSCSGSVLCQVGLYCDQDKLVCTAPGGQGASCTGDATCGPHLYCVSGTCQPPRTQGASCSSATPCDVTMLCSMATQKCEPVTWVSAGQSCGDTVLCSVGHCSMGVCPQVIPDGQPCATNGQAATCDAFAQCVNGVCALPTSATCP
jgi:hypothetical protein